MPLTQYERDLLLEHGIEITTCSKPFAIMHQGKRVTGLRLARMMLPNGKPRARRISSSTRRNRRSSASSTW